MAPQDTEDQATAVPQDTDDQALAAIQDSIDAAQDQFWGASPADQNTLRIKLSALYDAESKLKVAMLNSALVCTGKDVAQIQAIGADITRAANAQALAMAVVRLTGFLLTLA